MTTNKLVSSIDEKTWEEAKKYEMEFWEQNNLKNPIQKIIKRYIRALIKPNKLLKYIKYRDLYLGHGWDYWWQQQFDYYKYLPKQIDKAFEMGCGPYSILRLITFRCKIKEFHFSDPLIDVYEKFKFTWLTNIKKKKKNTLFLKSAGEKIDIPDSSYDLVVCINVLDHVKDASLCMNELIRITKKGGYLILGHDLTNFEDMEKDIVKKDIGHPIKIDHRFLESFVDESFITRLKKILPRTEGRNPETHYGTFIYIGQKYC